MTTQKNQSDIKAPKNFNFEISLLVMAKKMGLSFDELNYMSLQDFMDFADMWSGNQEGEEVVLEATQEDIDRFYSSM